MVDIWTGWRYLWIDTHSGFYTRKNDKCLKELLRIGKYVLTLRIKRTGYKKSVLETLGHHFGGWSTDLRKNVNVADEEEFEEYSAKNAKAKFCTLYIYDDNGKLCGSLDDLAWIVDKGLILVESGVAFDPASQKYIGFSHRGASSFGVGDKLFDESAKWDQLFQDYKGSEEAEGYYMKWLTAIDRASLDNDEFWLESLKNDGPIGFVPFNRRGIETIVNKSQALLAARRFSKYLG